MANISTFVLINLTCHLLTKYFLKEALKNFIIISLEGKGMEEKKIVLKWKSVKVPDTAHVSAMYCFKNCDKMAN